ncbi:kelch-like protein 24 [Branchiostoma lanceolatum]|uniref:kelch-like protein 24 n=1 Tax=Branchiostoma lanceolatum TaxID=7740 RepID=UPI0034558EA6
MWIFGDTHNSPILRDCARQGIDWQFHIVQKQEEFVTMDRERLVEIVSSNGLAVEREEVVFEAVMRWLKYDIPERKQYAADILKHVRLVLLPPDFLFDLVEKEELVMTSPECVRYLDRVKQFHILRDRRSQLGLNTTPRAGMFKTDAIVCVDLKPRENSQGGDDQHVVDCYNPLGRKWACLPPLPKSVMFPGVVTTLNNILFVVGGTYKDETVSNNVYSYNMHKNVWVQEPSMLHPRTQFGLVANGSHLYAVGGDSNGTSLSSVEAYNFMKMEWKELSPLPKKMRCHSTVMLKGVIYVLGGEIENALKQRTLSNRVYKYLPDFDRWFENLPMQIPRALAMATVLNDAIYIMGGFAELTQNWLSFSDPEHVLSATEVFRPEENYWSFGPHLPKETCAAGIVTLQNKIFILGGEGEGDFWNHILMYDPELTYWTQLPDVLPEYVSSFGCAVAKFHNLEMIEGVKWHGSEEMPWMAQNQRVFGL